MYQLSAVHYYKRFSETSMEIGREVAEYCYPCSHSGPFSVRISANDKLVAILPTLKEAERVAGYAIKPDGGYGSVYVSAAIDQEITHLNFEDWLF